MLILDHLLPNNHELNKDKDSVQKILLLAPYDIGFEGNQENKKDQNNKEDIHKFLLYKFQENLEKEIHDNEKNAKALYTFI